MVNSAKLGDREVKQRATDCNRSVAIPTLFNLVLRVLAVVETIAYCLAHCFRLAECCDEGLRYSNGVSDMIRAIRDINQRCGREEGT